jgi:hypothetical protein
LPNKSPTSAAFNGLPDNSALFSWTAGRYGNCTGTGPCVDYEYHLNADIAFNMFELRNTTNDQSWFLDGPRDIIESVAIALSERLQLNETTQTYWFHNMTDPDEYANNKDNGAFTVASTGVLLKAVNDLRFAEGQAVNETWTHQYENLELPRAQSDITLEYQTMNNSVAVKQADVVLLTFPLDYVLDYTAEQKLKDLDYYANKQSPDGPAMTYSVFAINANELSPSGTSAYTYMLNGNQPYLRAPWYQFSEQAVDDPSINGNTNPAFPFLTGHGGSNQIVPFGLLGLRTNQELVHISPSLPGQIPYVRVRDIYFAGARFSASLNNTHTNITRLATPLSTGLVDKYANATMPLVVGFANTEDAIRYELAINQTITVLNRVEWQNMTQPGNLIQSLPVSTLDPFTEGQFPEAALDGATATRWQPRSNATASLLVNMTSVPSQPLFNASFDFGMRPPRSLTIVLGNSTNVLAGTNGTPETYGPFDIFPEFPYNAEQAANSSQIVESVVGNSTTVSISGAWSGDYMRLEVTGCWEVDGKGATIGEVALIRG